MKVKDFLVGMGIGLLIGVVGLTLYWNSHSKTLMAENKRLKAEYEIVATRLDAMEKIDGQKIQAALKEVGDLQEKNDVLSKKNSELTQTVDILEANIGVLHAQNETLKTQVQPVIDANPALKMYFDNLTLEISEQSREIFTIKQKVVNAEQMAANSEKKFQDQSLISIAYKADLDGERALRLLAENRLSQQQKTILSLQKKATLGVIGTGTGLVISAVAVILLVLHR